MSASQLNTDERRAITCLKMLGCKPAEIARRARPLGDEI